jgi:hypothetical protein
MRIKIIGFLITYLMVNSAIALSIKPNYVEKWLGHLPSDEIEGTTLLNHPRFLESLENIFGASEWKQDLLRAYFTKPMQKLGFWYVATGHLLTGDIAIFIDSTTKEIQAVCLSKTLYIVSSHPVDIPPRQQQQVNYYFMTSRYPNNESILNLTFISPGRNCAGDDGKIAVKRWQDILQVVQ